MEKLMPVGYIAKAHGIKGEVLLKLFDSDSSYLSIGSVLTIKNTAYEIQRMRPVPVGLILALKGCTTRNESELLKGAEVFISANSFKTVGDERYLNQLLGFSVHLKGSLKGKVSGFAETAAHDFIRVELTSGGEVEIPYVEDFIGDINDLEQVIEVTCPEELFDLSFLSGGKK